MKRLAKYLYFVVFIAPGILALCGTDNCSVKDLLALIVFYLGLIAYDVMELKPAQVNIFSPYPVTAEVKKDGEK